MIVPSRWHRAGINETLTFELRVIGGEHIRKHADDTFVLVDCITPQMGSCFLHRLCDSFVVSFGEA
jgi:hypothetical protein